MNLLSWVIPAWAKWALLAAIALALYAFGRVDGERIKGSELADYKAAVATQATKVYKARVEILHEVEVKYVERQAKIITEVQTIIKEVPIHVSQAADDRCVVPAGLVRVHDTAFGFPDPAVAGEPDDGPAGISLSAVAATLAENAGACRQWREQALALRLAYEQVRVAAPAP